MGYWSIGLMHHSSLLVVKAMAQRITERSPVRQHSFDKAALIELPDETAI